MNKLGDYINIKTGKRDANEACSNGGYPFFTCAKEPSRIDFWSFDCECVLVAGNCNPHVSYYNGKFNAYQRVYVIQSRDKKLLNIKYLYYFLKKYMTLVLDKQRGAIEKFFCLDDFTDIKIHLPDHPTQLRIAAIMEWFIFRGYGGWGQPPSRCGERRYVPVGIYGGWGQPPSPRGDNGRARVLTRRYVNHAI
jgi:type I restriction enzyme S subunit